MKKLTALVATIFLLHTLYAQIEKGKIFIGGSIGFNISKSKGSGSWDNAANNSNISPQIGKAIQKNLIAGIQLSAGGGYRGDLSSEENYHNYGLGLFVRKYYQVAPRLMLFGQATISVNTSKQNMEINSVKVSENKNLNISLTIAPGISYNVSKKLWLEITSDNLVTVGYSSTKYNRSAGNGQPASESSSKNFYANGGSNVLGNFGIGVRWIS